MKVAVFDVIKKLIITVPEDVIETDTIEEWAHEEGQHILENNPGFSLTATLFTLENQHTSTDDPYGGLDFKLRDDDDEVH